MIFSKKLCTCSLYWLLDQLKFRFVMNNEFYCFGLYVIIEC